MSDPIPSPDEARREVQARLAAFEESVAAVHRRVEESSHKVEEAVERARSAGEEAKAALESRPWIGVAVCLGLGWWLGRRGRSRDRYVGRLSDGQEIALTLQPAKKGLLTALLGVAGGALSRALTQVAKDAIEEIREMTDGDGQPPAP